MIEKEPIAVAMSGGVDSTLTARLLLDQGRQVIGLFMDLGLEQSRATEAAVAAAGELGVELKILHLSQPFDRLVVQPFLDEYQAGRTPNPCGRCNRLMKFDQLLTKAAELGCSQLATGHYAALVNGPDGPEFRRGRDSAKEQSYFLAWLKPGWLNRLVFPLGDMTKAETRARAAELGLPQADQNDSQEICFLGDRSYKDFFLSRRRAEPGYIVDQDGNIIGLHKGLFKYTIGQRRGLGLPAARPYYVVALDPVKNRVVVGPRQAAVRQRAEAVDCSWLISPEAAPERLEVQVRYRSRPVDARLTNPGGSSTDVLFDSPVWGLAPGQLAAFYQGDRVLGGGWLR